MYGFELCVDAAGVWVEKLENERFFCHNIRIASNSELQHGPPNRESSAKSLEPTNTNAKTYFIDY